MRQHVVVLALPRARIGRAQRRRRVRGEERDGTLACDRAAGVQPAAVDAAGRLGLHVRPDRAAERELRGELGITVPGVGVEARVVLEGAYEDRAAADRTRLLLEVAAEAEQQLAARAPDLAALGDELERGHVARIGVVARVHRALRRRRGRRDELLAGAEEPALREARADRRGQTRLRVGLDA